jgi:hypothetical protein
MRDGQACLNQTRKIDIFGAVAAGQCRPESETVRSFFEGRAHRRKTGIFS